MSNAMLSQSSPTFDATTFNRTFAHHRATVNGVRLHYVIGGEGDPVVLLHGFPETWYSWRKIMPALAERHTVIAPDLRGFGDSEKPLTGSDKHTVAEDVYQLARQLGGDRAFLIGQDVGSWVAYAYAAAHPESVRRLVFIEALLPGIGLEQLMDVANGGSWHFGFHMNPDLPETLVEGKERTYIAWFLRHNAHVPDAITENDIDLYARSYAAPGGMRAAFSYYRTLLSVDAPQNRESANHKLRMPVLAIGGDKFLKDRPMQNMQAVAENVRGVQIKDCGHFVAEEQPDELVRELFSFFGEQRR